MNTKSKKKLNNFLIAINEETLSDYTGKMECTSLSHAIKKNNQELFLDTMIEMQCEWLNNIFGAISHEEKDAWYYLEKYICIDSLLVNFLTIKSGSTAQRVAAHLIYLLAKGYSSLATINYKLLVAYMKTKPDDIESPNIIKFAITIYQVSNNLAVDKNKCELNDLLLFETSPAINPSTIDKLVEYHINNLGINELDGIEFINLGCIPIEFMIINKLRERNKLPTIILSDILKTPFSNVPVKQLFNPINDKDFTMFASFLTNHGFEITI